MGVYMGELMVKRRKPAETPDSRELQLVNMAHDLAEKQILEGTASAQVITHFLKLGSSVSALEKEKIKRENLLLEAKIQGLESAKNVEQLYAEALAAMRSYSSGHSDESVLE
jgi:hypothetical protein